MDGSMLVISVIVVAFIGFIVWRWRKGGSSNPSSGKGRFGTKQVPGAEDRRE